MESFWPKKFWVNGGTKIRPGIPSNWKIFESNWLDMESQFKSMLRVNSNRLPISSQVDLNILQLLGIPGRILVPPVT